MYKRYHAIFSCTLGKVGVTAFTEKELQRQFNWFAKRYPDAKVISIMEVNYGSTKEELHEEGRAGR